MYDNILVGIDGSEHSFAAARTAGELVRKMGASSLWVVACYDPLSFLVGEPLMNDIVAPRILKAEGYLNRALAEIGEVAIEVKTEILEGHAAEAILNVAVVRKVELIIMGTRGLGQLAGLLLGSQSLKVVAHAHCPVLLVR